MLSHCCFCSGKFLSPRTYPVLLCFFHCLLNPLVSFLVRVCSFSFIPPQFQIFPLITEVENIFRVPRLFPTTFFPKYLTGCVSQCCIEGGNHGVYVHVKSLRLISATVACKAHATSGFRRTRNAIIARSWSLPISVGGGWVVRRCWVNVQCQGVLLIWIIVGQGPIVLAVDAGGGVWTFFLSSIFSLFFLPLWETVRYRLKYCLKGPLNPTQPTNQPSN